MNLVIISCIEANCIMTNVRQPKGCPDNSVTITSTRSKDDLFVVQSTSGGGTNDHVQ